MLVSVEIVSGCKVLKEWDVHQVSETVTLGGIYCGIISGKVESSLSFWIPHELQDQPFVCSIGKSQNGPFHDCPCSIPARNATDFAGKFMQYRVEPSDAHLSTSITVTREGQDAFSVLMCSQWQVQFVQRVSSPKNKKEELANAITSWLEKEGVGFQPTDVETKGKCLLITLTDALSVIDEHCQTLADRSYSVPDKFTYFSGYNVPEATSTSKKTLQRTAVEVNACKVFELLEKLWMSKGTCSEEVVYLCSCAFVLWCV